MGLLWYTMLFFAIWVTSHICYWNIRKNTFIPSWMIYGSVGISTVLVIYFVTEPSYAILYTAFAFGIVQGNQEVVAGE